MRRWQHLHRGRRSPTWCPPNTPRDYGTSTLSQRIRRPSWQSWECHYTYTHLGGTGLGKNARCYPPGPRRDARDPASYRDHVDEGGLAGVLQPHQGELHLLLPKERPEPVQQLREERQHPAFDFQPRSLSAARPSAFIIPRNDPALPLQPPGSRSPGSSRSAAVMGGVSQQLSGRGGAANLDGFCAQPSSGL